MIVKNVNKYHYSPRKVDDLFAQLVFIKVLDLLDYYKMFFSKEDVEYLSKTKYIIDNDILNKEGVFFTNISKLYKQRLQKTDSIILSFQKVDFNFNIEDTFIFHKENIDAYIESAYLNAITFDPHT